MPSSLKAVLKPCDFEPDMDKTCKKNKKQLTYYDMDSLGSVFIIHGYDQKLLVKEIVHDHE